jgi:hypothetical protein
MRPVMHETLLSWNGLVVIGGFGADTRALEKPTAFERGFEDSWGRAFENSRNMEPQVDSLEIDSQPCLPRMSLDT